MDFRIQIIIATYYCLFIDICVVGIFVIFSFVFHIITNNITIKKKYLVSDFK